VPDPPPPLPEAVILPDEVVGSHVEPTVAVRMGLGADGLWSTGGWDAGLQGFFALALGHDWTVGLDGAFHPFHDLQRDGRPLGVTGYRATVFGQRKLVQRPGWRWDVRAGLGISGLSAVGAETQGSELQPTLTAAAPLRMALTGPLALEVDLGFVVTPGATRALHQNATLVERGAVQVRSGVLLTWTIR
jgi:hypothetical protein